MDRFSSRHGGAVRQHSGYQQRKQHIDIVRQFERKQNGGKGGSHGAAENRAHADQGPEAGAFVGQEHALDTTQGRAHHEQRREHAA
jgi:hypothetical protein